MKPFKGLSIKLDESVDNFLKCIRIAETEIIDKKVDKEIFLQLHWDIIFYMISAIQNLIQHQDR